VRSVRGHGGGKEGKLSNVTEGRDGGKRRLPAPREANRHAQRRAFALATPLTSCGARCLRVPH
jgi:hypothetical protein